MNLDELQSVRDRERQTDKLQQLRASFYADTGEFVDQLRRERDRAAAAADDPWNSPEAMQLNDEIEAATQLVEDIYERRIGKIVKAASLDAAGLPADVDGLTAEEQELFEVLVDDIEHHRERVLAVVEGTTEPPEAESEHPEDGAERTAETDHPGGQSVGTPHEPTPEPTRSADAVPAERAEVGAADAMGPAADDGPGTETGHGQPAPPEEPAAQDGGGHTGPPDGRSAGRDQPVRNDGGSPQQPPVDEPQSNPTHEATRTDESHSPIERERVLVTEDVGTFLGSDDRDYDLAASDVVTLPASNAEVLLERGAAERL